MRPALSVTGYPTIAVSARTQLGLLYDLKEKGMVIHPPQAGVVWALTAMCRRNLLPYEVAIVKDKAGKVRSVAVAVADGQVNYQTPKSWTTTIVESYKGIGHEVVTVEQAATAPLPQPQAVPPSPLP
jgi:hypothetical protein